VLTRSNLPVVVTGAAVCVVLTSVMLALSTVPACDLAVYRAGGYALLHGISLYGPQFPDNLPFTYPPFAAWPLVVLAPLPPGLCRWLWSFATLAVLGWVIAVSFHRILPNRPWPRALAVSGLIVAFAVTSPMTDHLGFGQINVFLMALCLADLLGARPRWLPQGVLIGLATVVKLVPGLFIVYLLVTRRFRAAAAAILAAVAATLLAAAVSPADSRLYFTDLLWHLGQRVGLNNNATVGNQSLQGALLRVLPGSSVGLLWAILAGVVLIAGMWGALRAYRGAGDVAGAAVTGLVSVMISPVSWPHHLVWFVPAIAALIGDGRRRRRLLAGAVVWLILLARTHRLGQDVVDLYHSGTLRWIGELLRDSFLIVGIGVTAALAARSG
jgi:alpha-1,2-mannosyltransferase